ncbi:MAG: hypothetical protein LBF86_02365 [Helicobacteraceae bacterium]|nr:hypothetical protein [Helicobacteraceae bacterium]
MDTSLIPPGEYCYRVIKIREGEILSQEIEKFGRELREYSYNGAYKEVLCPYWQKTAYGTVRCNFLDREFVDDEDPKSMEKIVAHFGSPDAPDKFKRSWALSDEIKICGIRDDEDGKWID